MLPDNNGARVSYVSDKQVSAVGEQTHAGGPAVADISAHVAHFVVRLLKASDEGWVHLGQGRIRI